METAGTTEGTTTTALKLRRLTPAGGDRHTCIGRSVDILADARYGDATQFWHVADANTALDGRTSRRHRRRRSGAEGPMGEQRFRVCLGERGATEEELGGSRRSRSPREMGRDVGGARARDLP